MNNANTQHTAGPWLYDAEDCTVYANDGLSGDLSICTLDPMDRGGPKRFHHGAITAANARLIAAAPDLLEALDYALEYLESWEDLGANSHCRKARAAIAKATEADSGNTLGDSAEQNAAYQGQGQMPTHEPASRDVLAELYRQAANMTVKAPKDLLQMSPAGAYRAGTLDMRQAIADVIAAQSDAEHAAKSARGMAGTTGEKPRPVTLPEQRCQHGGDVNACGWGPCVTTAECCAGRAPWGNPPAGTTGESK